MSIRGGTPDERDQFAYNDLEYQEISTEVNSTSSTPDDTALTTLSLDPVGPQELDNNELAELVYLRRHAMAQIRENETLANQSRPSTAQFSAVLEVNSGEAEWLTTDQFPNAGPPGYKVDTKLQNLDAFETVGHTGFIDAGTAFAGASGGDDANYREYHFAGPNSNFLFGPILDANDDLDIRQEIDKEDLIYPVRLRVQWVLGWMIHEVEGARPQFGVPL